ncbi:transposase domain-containing protein [Streptomyces sp. CNQ-509]|uniref:transposase domain-containing protein n=1 Tax=Streptomyces sp. CNQ-509 TaxID=444103 RepID=UPI003464038E
MVDEVLAEAGRTQQRIRDLPSRVVLYMLLAGSLFPGIGWKQVWQRMTAGLEGLATARRPAPWPKPAGGPVSGRCATCSTCCVDRLPGSGPWERGGEGCWSSRCWSPTRLCDWPWRMPPAPDRRPTRAATPIRVGRDPRQLFWRHVRDWPGGAHPVHKKTENRGWQRELMSRVIAVQSLFPGFPSRSPEPAL